LAQSFDKHLKKDTILFFLQIYVHPLRNYFDHFFIEINHCCGCCVVCE